MSRRPRMVSPEMTHDRSVPAAARGGQAEHVAGLVALARRHRRVHVVVAEPVVGQHVGPRVKQDAVARQPVAAGAPDLLVVALDRSRHVAVDDVADVRLVDPHPERDRRDHHVDLVARERVLGPVARRRGPGRRGTAAARTPRSTQVLGQRFARLAGQRVDDPALIRAGPRPAGRWRCAPPCRPVLAVFPLVISRQVQVGAEEAAPVTGRVDHRQLADDVGASPPASPSRSAPAPGCRPAARCRTAA